MPKLLVNLVERQLQAIADFLAFLPISHYRLSPTHIEIDTSTHIQNNNNKQTHKYILDTLMYLQHDVLTSIIALNK